MRVATEHRLVTAHPGETVDVRVDVVNTGELIEGVTAHLIGLPDGQITVEPQLLPLFPDAQGQITLSIGVPSHQPAGMHPLTIAVVSHGAGSPTQHVDLDLSVSARPDVRMSTDPQSIRSRRTGRFVVTVENAGNVALDATLTATQEDARTRARFTPERVRVEPGTSVPTILAVKGPRMLTGAETDRMVTVGLVATRAHTIPAMEETETGPELERQTVVRLRQKPMVSRGLLTALILVGIVVMWAAIFLLGLTQVLAGDPMTKTAPASFFPVAAGSGVDGAGGADGAQDGAAAPPGAMPKSGLLPAGVGGEISGTVRAASTQQPAGRITVQAFRQGRDGLRQISSAASQTDGTYSVAGLFPTGYLLKFSADGYRPVWYPNAPSRRGATEVVVAARGHAEGYHVVIEGEPAPATYELSFTAAGYQTTKVTTTVAAGETRIQPDVVLNAGTGSISGRVTDGRTPLGNVTITTTVAGQEVSVITPTTGQVGSFALENLPTPGTYMLTFSSPEHGTRAEIVDLGAGQSRGTVDVDLVAGTGSVTGVLLGPDGKGLGGATVTVGGSVQAGGSVDADSLPTTTTLTEGAVGTFSISGLAAPGDYTLTFTREGYAAETVPISLSGSGAPPEITARLGTKLGGIRGSVVGPAGGAYVGATVTATNGARTWSTTSSSPGGALSGGGYLFSGLEPGTYSVTVTADGMRQQTGLVTVASGDTAVQGFSLRAVG